MAEVDIFDTSYSYAVLAVDEEGDPSEPDSTTTDAEPLDTSYDGTFDGLSESLSPTPESNILINAIDSLAEQVSAWWVGWWPRLHVMLDFMTPNGGTATLHFSVDLLFDLDFEDSSFDTPVDDQMTQTQKTEWSSKIARETNKDYPLYHLIIAATALVAFGLGVTSGLLIAPLPPGYHLAVILGYFIVWSMWIVALVNALFLGIIGPDFMTGILTAFLQNALEGFLTAIAISVIGTLIYFKSGAEAMLDNSLNRLKWGFISLVFFLFIIGATLIIWANAVEMSIMLFMGET